MEKSTNDREGNYEKVSMRNSIIRREIIELSKKFTFTVNILVRYFKNC